ncbi:N-acetyltransferase [Paenibacillus sp. IB182496]|uniref:N-acetyltransferase n=1 Tax=Paenibacillus sabuli TaxID=2772509 RepID=A0A927BQC5_9BACL|nr:GNAT family N-acetyltransferase [Paenibacillus sabuli]MBD2844797.1 N-acetyltransferase [Paenibacillus sabuli]
MAQIRSVASGYVMEENGQVVGQVEVDAHDDGVLEITHTYVKERVRGRGLGEQLIECVVRQARRNGRAIVPSCPYALALFERKASYRDVWQQRAHA